MYLVCNLTLMGDGAHRYRRTAEHAVGVCPRRSSVSTARWQRSAAVGSGPPRRTGALCRNSAWPSRWGLGAGERDRRRPGRVRAGDRTRCSMTVKAGRASEAGLRSAAGWCGTYRDASMARLTCPYRWTEVQLRHDAPSQKKSADPKVGARSGCRRTSGPATTMSVPASASRRTRGAWAAPLSLVR